MATTEYQNLFTESGNASEICGTKFNEGGITRGDLDVVALVVVIIFYLLILVIGIVASRLVTGQWKVKSSEDQMVAGRNIGLVVGIFTMTATWVGGGYINGTAEYVFTPGYGLIWTQAPWGYLMGLFLVSSISSTAWGADGWLGTLAPDAWVGNYIDSGLLLILGGIPWQVYFQRVLSQKTAKNAQILSIVAAGGCMFLAIPCVLIGALAKSTDWNATEYREFGCIPVRPDDYKLALPMVLMFLTPKPVAVIGLGAVAAAVMSSTDSAVLSAGSQFARNVYTPIASAIKCKFNAGKVSETEIVWVMRFAIIVVAGAGTTMAILVNSIYALFVLCGDLIYVILFPQLLLVVYLKKGNTYGALTGYIVGMFFRLTGGEILLNFPLLIKYPYYDEESGYQLFPFKTLVMLISLITIVIVSYLADFMFHRIDGLRRFDVLKCFIEKYDLTDDEGYKGKTAMEDIPGTKF